MALYAETIVEEWFNRNGYFTIRGLKDKISECDVLAVKHNGESLECIHCEVQVSIRPVNYINSLTKSAMQEIGAPSKTSARTRPDHIIKECAEAYVYKKFTDYRKVEIRNKLAPKSEWRYLLVHGNVKDERELEYINNTGVEILSIKKIMKDLVEDKTDLKFIGSSAGDMIEMLNFLELESYSD